MVLEAIPEMTNGTCFTFRPTFEIAFDSWLANPSAR
jgi:hypothetical protein